MANTFTFDQISTLLASLTQQATGQAVLTPTNTYEFVNVAQTALQAGYDTLATGVNQVLSKTIYSIRPYQRKFAGLMLDDVQWGNHVRKLSPVDPLPEDNEAFKLVNGVSVDQQVVRKPEVLQTNFYGSQVWQYGRTWYDDQLDQAFSGPEELARFFSMEAQNILDRQEQDIESCNRGAVANFIGSKITIGGDGVFHALTRYNTEKGTTLTATTVRQGTNFEPFVRWLYAQMMTVSQWMTERTTAYQQQITGKTVIRHTPVEDQKLYLLSEWTNAVAGEVFSNIFRPEYLSLMDYETVSFWQSFNSPDQIDLDAGYINAAGAAAHAAVADTDIIGVLFDREAIGSVLKSRTSGTAPHNARGHYTNQWWSHNQSWFNDHTEKGVVFILD